MPASRAAVPCRQRRSSVPSPPRSTAPEPLAAGLPEFCADAVRVDAVASGSAEINGLAVLSFGNFLLGHPSRITARVRPGSGGVLDIERKVELGGSLHSKGVLDSPATSLRGRLDGPLSLSASLALEQSYGGVDGDSASSTELYALLSALAELPIRQSWAVTGSVDQFGRVQAIGGVNEKIEGFFDICRARGLTSEQGVLIPASNVQHLMLRQEVVDACRNGQFKIFAVKTIDQGIALLAGVAAGQRDAEGRSPADSVNGRVEARLNRFTQRLGASRKRMPRPMRPTVDRAMNRQQPRTLLLRRGSSSPPSLPLLDAAAELAAMLEVELAVWRIEEQRLLEVLENSPGVAVCSRTMPPRQ